MKHHPSVPGSKRFIGKEEPASPSLTQQSGTWSSVSLHPDNGISSEQRLPGSDQGTERWELKQAPVSHRTRRKAQLAEATHIPLFTSWVELLQPGLSDSSFFKAGVVPGCSCPLWQRELQQCQKLKCFVQYSDVFDRHLSFLTSVSEFLSYITLDLGYLFNILE